MSARVAVGVPLRDDTVNLRAALRSLLEQTFDEVEIVVVDDSTSDEPGEIINNEFRSDIQRYERNPGRLGLIGGDPAGYPNGRRIFDDVTDVTLRVGVGGVLAAPFPGYTPGVNDRLGDGVNVDDQPYHAGFPYVGSAPDGRNRRHVDPGEAGCGPDRTSVCALH